MSLTVGTGPFGPYARGRFDFDPPEHVVYVEPWPRRVRAFADGSLVVDSERAVLVYESGRLPQYAFPAEDVFVDARPEREVEGYVRLPWAAADRWLEEDEEVVVHLRDPYHRIDVLRSSRRVRVLIAGELVADSGRPSILFETGLPARYYLPQDEVRLDALEAAPELRTGCAYKGWARYWHARTTGSRAPAVAWSYPDPLHDGEPVRDLIAFFSERPEIVVEVDGVPFESEPTIYSTPAWTALPWARATTAARA